MKSINVEKIILDLENNISDWVFVEDKDVNQYIFYKIVESESVVTWLFQNPGFVINKGSLEFYKEIGCLFQEETPPDLSINLSQSLLQRVEKMRNKARINLQQKEQELEETKLKALEELIDKHF